MKKEPVVKKEDGPKMTANDWIMGFQGLETDFDKKHKELEE